MSFINRFNKTSFAINRRKKFKKNYPKFSKFSSVAGKVFGLQRQVRFMKGMINSERQYADVAINTQFSTTGSVTLINSIGEGDDVDQRKGNSILHKYITIQGRVVMNSTSPFSIVRMIIFVDKSNLGSSPAATDLLEFDSINSLKNKDKTSRFVILRDREYEMSNTGEQGCPIKEYIRTNFHCKYTGTTSTTQFTNAIYIYIVSNEATNTPTVTLNIRNAYYDN